MGQAQRCPCLDSSTVPQRAVCAREGACWTSWVPELSRQHLRAQPKKYTSCGSMRMCHLGRKGLKGVESGAGSAVTAPGLGCCPRVWGPVSGDNSAPKEAGHAPRPPPLSLHSGWEWREAGTSRCPAGQGTGGRATPREVQNHWGDRGWYESLPTPLAHRAPRTLHPWGSPPSPSHPEPPGPSPGWPLQEEMVLRLLLPSP